MEVEEIEGEVHKGNLCSLFLYPGWRLSQLIIRKLQKPPPEICLFDKIPDPKKPEFRFSEWEIDKHHLKLNRTSPMEQIWVQPKWQIWEIF